MLEAVVQKTVLFVLNYLAPFLKIDRICVGLIFSGLAILFFDFYAYPYALYQGWLHCLFFRKKLYMSLFTVWLCWVLVAAWAFF